MRLIGISFILGITLLSLNSCNENSSTDNTGATLEIHEEVNEVECITLERKDFQVELISNGKLKAKHRSSLSFGTIGTIATLNVSNGESVKAGTIIAKLDRKDLELALESAENSLKQAEFEMYDILAGQGFQAKDTTTIPENALYMAKIRSGYTVAKNNLERTRIEHAGTILKAPYSGKIADLKYGKYDNYGSDPVCSIIDDSAFYVEFSIMESEYQFLTKGMEVKVIPYSLNGKEIIGKVDWINPSIDKNGQITARASFKNDGSLIDGMNVKVVAYHNIPDQLIVPKSAILVRDDFNVLFTYTEDGIARWIYVNILDSNSSYHMIEANTDRGSSLNEGDIVITKGNLNLADGSSVQIKR